MHRYRLEHNLDQARREKDHRTVALIGQYLDRYYEAHPRLGEEFIESLFDMDEQEDSADPLEQLFDHLPDEIYHKLNNRLASLFKKTSPERLAQELNKIVGNNSNLLLAMMQEPDLFTALMILKAADELSIDTGVTLDDVLECFAVDKASKSFPFPF